jgi:hypothetical protein
MNSWSDQMGLPPTCSGDTSNPDYTDRGDGLFNSCKWLLASCPLHLSNLRHYCSLLAISFGIAGIDATKKIIEKETEKKMKNGITSGILREAICSSLSDGVIVRMNFGHSRHS